MLVAIDRINVIILYGKWKWGDFAGGWFGWK
jgi:hypothetical protein